MKLYFELLILLSGGRLYVSFVWHSVGRAVWQTRNWKAAQETGKYLEALEFPFISHCSDVSDAFILRRRMHQLQRTGNFSPSIALHLLFGFDFEKATAKKTPPNATKGKQMREIKVTGTRNNAGKYGMTRCSTRHCCLRLQENICQRKF